MFGVHGNCCLKITVVAVDIICGDIVIELECWTLKILARGFYGV